MSELYECPTLNIDCPYLDRFGCCSDPEVFHGCDDHYDELSDDMKSFLERM